MNSFIVLHNSFPNDSISVRENVAVTADWLGLGIFLVIMIVISYITRNKK